MGGHAPFLRQLGPDDATALVGRAHRRKVSAGERLVHEGSAGVEVLVVLSGKVKLVATGTAGREVVLAIRGPGELIGEMAALGGLRRTATAIAVDDVEAAHLRAAELRAFLAEHPRAAEVMMRMLVHRWAQADRDRVDLATQDSVGRLAKRLLELASEHGSPTAGGTVMEVSLSQEDLASWTGATRETVSRALRLMRQLGWIATGHMKITILDPGALRERAGGAAVS